MANNYNGVPRPPVVFCTQRRRAARRPPRDLRGPVWAETYRVGLLGHGTVGAAFEQLLARARRSRSRTSPAASPRSRGVLTRSRGDFEEILANSDLIVELIGGIEPARDYVLRAMQAGKHVVSANKLLLASHGEELWATRARAQGPAALRGRRGRRRAGHPRAPGVARRRPRRAHPRDRQRHHELHPHRDGARRDVLRRRARRARRSSATPRPTRPTTSPAATPRPRWRSSPGWRSRRPSTSTRSTYEGIEHITRRGRRLRARSRARPEADRHRRARRRRHLASACTRRSSIPATRWRASTAPSTPSRSSPTRSPRSR